MQNDHSIGVVFTPREWAKFAIEEFSIFNDWMNGSSIFDPTMGSGDLLLALVEYGIEQGVSLDQLPIKNLFGNELKNNNYQKAIERFKEEFGVDLTTNFTNYDLLTLKSAKYDIIFGNPPWINFSDLPTHYKEEIKEKFHSYDLVENAQKLLLGGSRIDLAALIIQRSINDFLSLNGNAYFFIPLSLLLNDGAHSSFRKYKIGTTSYALKCVYDFGRKKIFKDVATRYGLVQFKRDESTTYPIDYRQFEDNLWNRYQGKPLININDPLSIYGLNKTPPLDDFEPIELPKHSTPRQGINTCGANSVFFFNSFVSIDQHTCLVNGKDILPLKFVHPLLTASNFKEKKPIARKWVLLPYTSLGKPLNAETLATTPLLKSYLDKHKSKLQSRKGTMIGSWIKRGIWWSLLGVGSYNFASYKIIWEAYGKITFRPLLMNSKWQVNQALQCYIPLNTKSEAKAVLLKLKDPKIEEYLLSMKMEGTMNWAQPGKIKKLIKFND